MRHKEYKLKRAEIRNLMVKNFKKPKVVNQTAMDKFKAVPYQKIYQERMKENELGRQGTQKA